MKQTQNPGATEQLRRDFSVKGSLDLKLDETIVPVRSVMSPWRENPAYRDTVRPVMLQLGATAQGALNYSGLSFGVDPQHVLVVTQLRVYSTVAGVFNIEHQTPAQAATVTQVSRSKMVDMHDRGHAWGSAAYGRQVHHTSTLGTAIVWEYIATGRTTPIDLLGGWAIYGAGAAEHVDAGAELCVWNTTANAGFWTLAYGLLYVSRP